MTTTLHPVAAKLHLVRDELSVNFLERRSVIEMLILTLLSKEHGFLLGPPGTGKSAMIRALVDRITFDPAIGTYYFEALLSRTRPDAAILGPYNLPELRDNGDFHRKINGFLPSAIIAFIDEIGKMSPTLGHDLLAILNERLYHEVNGGRSAKKVPLYSAFTASNELITADSDDAAALWDRLLVRDEVDSIQETSNFVSLLAQAVAAGPSTTTNVVTEIDWTDLATVIDTVIPTIPLPHETAMTIAKLRAEIRGHGYAVSDRRWKQSIRVMQAAAFLDGSDQVTDDHVMVLRYTLWDTPEQRATIDRLCLSASNPMNEAIISLLDRSDEIHTGIEQRKGQSLESRAQYGAEANAKLKVLVAELGQLRQDALAAGRGTSKLEEAGQRLETIRRKIYTDCLDMAADQVK